jgi:hypothetical protein
MRPFLLAAREELGVRVRLARLLGALGGPDYEVSYPNGDRVAYVTAVYEARIIDGGLRRLTGSCAGSAGSRRRTWAGWS